MLWKKGGKDFGEQGCAVVLVFSCICDCFRLLKVLLLLNCCCWVLWKQAARTLVSRLLFSIAWFRKKVLLLMADATVATAGAVEEGGKDFGEQACRLIWDGSSCRICACASVPVDCTAYRCVVFSMPTKCVLAGPCMGCKVGQHFLSQQTFVQLHAVGYG